MGLQAAKTGSHRAASSGLHQTLPRVSEALRLSSLLSNLPQSISSAIAERLAAKMAKRLIPLLDRVLVEKLQPATKTVGGILLPDTAVSKMSEGKVVATGPGRRNLQSGELIPVGVTEGQKVLLPEYGGTSVKLDNKEYLIYRDEELIGVLTE